MCHPLWLHDCLYTHTHTHTRFFQVQTSGLMIKKDQTQNVDDCILIKVTVVLSEITLFTSQEE